MAKRAVNDHVLQLSRVRYGLLVPQLRGGQLEAIPRGDRPVGVDGVPRVHSGQRDETPAKLQERVANALAGEA